MKFSGAAHAEIAVPELGTCFRLKKIDGPCAERETSVRELLLDLDRLTEPLVLRNWRSGDSYRPRGRRNRRKLRDMFVAGRIARSERSLWPVLESGGRVVWPGEWLLHMRFVRRANAHRGFDRRMQALR